MRILATSITFHSMKAYGDKVRYNDGLYGNVLQWSHLALESTGGSRQQHGSGDSLPQLRLLLLRLTTYTTGGYSSSHPPCLAQACLAPVVRAFASRDSVRGNIRNWTRKATGHTNVSIVAKQTWWLCQQWRFIF